MLGYRMFVRLGDADAHALLRAREQFHSWLREKGYNADLLEPGRLVRLADDVGGLLLERTGPGGRGSVRARLIEDRRGGRRWTTELTVHLSHKSGGWVLLDVDQPTDKATTRAPRLAGYLLDVLHCLDGSARLGPTVRLAPESEVENVMEVVCDPERHGLVFVAGSSQDMDVDAWRHLVDELLRDTAGLAANYVLDPIATARFNSVMGTHGVLPGSVRTYLSDPDPAVELDALRHRILSAGRIDKDPRADLARLLGRRAREVAITTPLPAAVRAVLRRFEVEIDELTVAGVASQGPHGGQREEPSASAADGTTSTTGAVPDDRPRVQEETGQARQNALAELAILRAALSDQQELVTDLRREVEDAQLDHAAADEERLRAEAQVRYLQKRLAEAGHKDAWVVPPLEAQDIRVSSYDDLLTRIGMLTLVQFTGDHGPLEELEHRDPIANWAAKAWEAAQALEDYATTVRDGTGSPGGVDRYLTAVPAGKHSFSSNRHATTESAEVRTNPRFSAERMFPVPPTVCPDGRIAMGAHFKLTQRRVLSPRMHYYDDTKGTGLVYIGYIGKHLRTKQTN